MKILLHMGQGKAGSTALQQSLDAASGLLRPRGVLYPKFSKRAIAHHLLLALCDDPRKLPDWTLQDLGGAEGALKQAQAAWKQTCDEIQANRPALLVLSSELLVDRTDQAAKARLVRLLSEVCPDITPVIYVRHPVDYYRSVLQELLKASDVCRPPVCQNLRQKVLDVEGLFPGPPVLITYDRNLLLGGDVIADFADRFLSPWLDGDRLPPAEANPGLSAEALVLMSELRAEAGHRIEAARRISRLKHALLGFDQTEPATQPFTLRPDVAEAALRSATCHRWLVETGRLQIPGLEIDRIDGAPVPGWMLEAPPARMFLHDPERLARMRRSLEQQIGKRLMDWVQEGMPARSSQRSGIRQYLDRKMTGLREWALRKAGQKDGSGSE